MYFVVPERCRYLLAKECQVPTEPSTRHFLDQLRECDEHHVAILPFCTNLSTRGKMTELSNNILERYVGKGPGEDMIRLACPMRRCILKGDMVRLILVLHDEVIAKVSRDGCLPCQSIAAVSSIVNQK